MTLNDARASKGWMLVAILLSLIGGALMVVAGAVLQATVSAVDTIVPGIAAMFLVLAVAGIVSGVLVLIGATLLYLRPQHHVISGILIVVCSTVSIVGLGGFYIGLALGVAGGALAIAWKEEGTSVPVVTSAPAYGPAPIQVVSAPSNAPGAEMMGRFCRSCGNSLAPAAKFCRTCGTRIA